MIGIIMYFTYRYDKKNIEGFQESNENIKSLIKILSDKNLQVDTRGNLLVKTSNDTYLPIYDSSNNSIKYGNFNLDKSGDVSINNTILGINGTVKKKY